MTTPDERSQTFRPAGISKSVIEPNTHDFARLRWRCRRGMKELDILLERYLRQRFEHAPPAEQSVFLQLLDCEDPDLWIWVIGQAEPPTEFSDVVRRLRGDA